jgi:hypothetical protein
LFSLGSFFYRAEESPASNIVEMPNQLPSSPMDIHIVSDQREKCAYSPCNISNGGCSDICLTSSRDDQVECACPSGAQLK